MKPGSRCIVDLVTVARAVPHRGGRALETLIEWHLVDPVTAGGLLVSGISLRVAERLAAPTPS